MGTTFAAIFIALALLSVGVVYGTDVFFTVIGRRALARSTEQGIADVMGHLHETGDARMPLFGALGLLATAASILTSGLRQPAGGSRPSPSCHSSGISRFICHAPSRSTRYSRPPHALVRFRRIRDHCRRNGIAWSVCARCCC